MKKNLLFILVSLLATSIIAGHTASAQAVGPVVSLTGNIFNEVTKQPVTVFLLVLDQDGKRVTATRSNSAENGYYYITGLKPGKTYTISIKQKDYLNEQFTLEVANTDKYQEISKDFLVKPLEKNAYLKLSVPPFELNKSKLRFGSEFLLDDMANTLKNNPTVKFEILCYPDNAKDPKENQQLTDERSKALMNYFVSQGIDVSRITTSGSNEVDSKNPPPTKTAAKGKRYIGPSYIVIKDFQ